MGNTSSTWFAPSDTEPAPVFPASFIRNEDDDFDDDFEDFDEEDFDDDFDDEFEEEDDFEDDLPEELEEEELSFREGLVGV